jgi:ketosteroid isomerase-like protein
MPETSGDMAYSFGTNAFSVPGQEGHVDTLRGQGVVVWRKMADGRWRAAVDIWTPQASEPARAQ